MFCHARHETPLWITLPVQKAIKSTVPSRKQYNRKSFTWPRHCHASVHAGLPVTRRGRLASHGDGHHVQACPCFFSTVTIVKISKSTKAVLYCPNTASAKIRQLYRFASVKNTKIDQNGVFFLVRLNILNHILFGRFKHFQQLLLSFIDS